MRWTLQQLIVGLTLRPGTGGVEEATQEHKEAREAEQKGLMEVG